MDFALTLDYELFGDGSGNVHSDVIEPTEKLFKILQKYNIKITIFFEIVEYWKLHQEWKKGNKMGYLDNPAESMKQQIIRAYNTYGHDIQLHIHPQWINSAYKKKWIVDKNWRMEHIPSDKNSEYNITLSTILKQGKETLESWIKPYFSQYKCNIFRAGAFNILPSERIFSELRNLGFIADSSVYAGGYEINNVSYIDYRTVNNKIPYWFCNDDNAINQRSFNQTGILELSIFSSSIRRIMKLDYMRILGLWKNKTTTINKLTVRTENKSWLQKIGYLFEKEHVTWDFCLFNHRKWKKFYSIARSIKKDSALDFHPFIIIGHSKSVLDFKILERNIGFLSKKGNFWTLNQIITKVYQSK